MPLTREEANVLTNRLTELNALFCNVPGAFTPELKIQYILKCINNFTEKQTEKPKRKIQKGDIYKDGSGILMEVKYLENDTIFTTDDDSYYMDGRYKEKANFEYDLDLSKRYKLVEIDDE